MNPLLILTITLLTLTTLTLAAVAVHDWIEKKMENRE